MERFENDLWSSRKKLTDPPSICSWTKMKILLNVLGGRYYPSLLCYSSKPSFLCSFHLLDVSYRNVQMYWSWCWICKSLCKTIKITTFSRFKSKYESLLHLWSYYANRVSEWAVYRQWSIFWRDDIENQRVPGQEAAGWSNPNSVPDFCELGEEHLPVKET